MNEVKLKTSFLLIIFFILHATCHSAVPSEAIKIEFSNLARIIPWERSAISQANGGISLFTGRDSIESSDRWMDILVKLENKDIPVERTSLLVTVNDMESRLLVRSASGVRSDRAIVRIDMRSLGRERAKARIEWMYEKRLLGSGEIWIMADEATPLESKTRIPVRLDIPEGIDGVKGYPVRFGLPVPRGSLWREDGLKVVEATGRDIPFQLETAGKWSESGSIKWIWIDALITGKDGDLIYVVPETGKKKSLFPRLLSVDGETGKLVVKTGAAEYTVGKDGGLIKEIRCKNRLIAGEGRGRGLYVVDHEGRIGKASDRNASMKIESTGPVSAVIRIEGDYVTDEGENLARHITRLTFTAGRTEVGITHTLVITRNTGDVWFRDIGWEFEVYPGAEPRGSFSMTPANSRNPAEGKVILEEWEAMADGKGQVKKETEEKVVSVDLGNGRVYSSIQKEGVTLGLKPIIYSWTRKNPSTPWIPFLRGSNVALLKEEGKEEPLFNGERIGDWSAVEGGNGGLVFSCRDASAQHPKEMELSRNSINMKLFSYSASGNELDFKMKTVMENWGMLPIEKVEGRDKVPEKLLKDYVSFVSRHSSNAVGWSKTHELLISPLLPGINPGEICRLHSRQVFAHVSPEWIRKTGVLGALHPVDMKNYQLEETLISNLFWGKVKQGLGGETGGFIDYNAGPIWIIHDLRGGSYTIRSDSWYLYARSAERSIREFAQGANRAFLDNNISHWNGPGKTKGLILSDVASPGSIRERNRPLDLPLYWVGTSKKDEPLATAGNLDQALLDYYITGNRRSGDILSNYSDAIKDNLTKEIKHWRVISVMRNILEAYEYSWEPRLRELIYELFLFHLYDPEGELLMTKARPHRSSTYKMETDGDVFIMLYDLFGDRLFHEMAKRTAVYNWEKSDISPPIYGQNRSTGYMGHFLWENTASSSVAARFDYSRRRLVAEIMKDPSNGHLKLTCVSQVPRYFKGLPISMDVIDESESKGMNPSSWISFKVDEPPARIFFVKPGEDDSLEYFSPGRTEASMEFIVRLEGNSSAEHFKGREENGVIKPWTTGGRIKLKPYSVFRYIWAGHDLHSVTEKSYGVSKVCVPKDAPGGLYEIEINDNNQYVVFADNYAPLAIYAPAGWTPPAMNPPVRICFRMAEDTVKGRIYFSKGARLFYPDGEPFADNKKLNGWVDLPREKPGLWTFESIDPGKIMVENITPFFGMGNIELYDRHLRIKKPPLEKVSGSLEWPSTWRIFGPFHKNDPILPASTLNSFPASITSGERSYEARDVNVEGCIYDFPDILKKEPGGSVAYVFLTFNAEKDGEATLGMGADWWMQAWINGELFHDTTETSNIRYPFSIWNHLVNVKVKKGRNLLAVRYIRGGGSELALGGPDQLRLTPLPPEPSDMKEMSQVEKEFRLFVTGRVR